MFFGDHIVYRLHSAPFPLLRPVFTPDAALWLPGSLYKPREKSCGHFVLIAWKNKIPRWQKCTHYPSCALFPSGNNLVY